MAKISSYPIDNNISLSDKVIGTDADSNDATKNFTVGGLLNLFENSAGFVRKANAKRLVWLLNNALPLVLQKL